MSASIPLMFHEEDPECPKYCPECHTDRNILMDMYVSHTRGRKEAAAEVMSNCESCRECITARIKNHSKEVNHDPGTHV